MLKKKTKEAADSVRKEPNEVPIVISRMTGETIYKGEGTDPQVCNIPDEVDLKDTVVVHNHPDGSISFSWQDIQLACAKDMDEIVAATEKYNYSMKRPKGGWDDAYYRENIEPLFEWHGSEVAKECLNRFNKGEIKAKSYSGKELKPPLSAYEVFMSEEGFNPVLDAKDDFAHQVWTRVAKDLNLDYKRTPV